MSKFNQRQLQVGEHIKRVLAGLFLSGDFGEDLSKNVSISQVKIASGLKHANIFISCLTEEETKKKVLLLNENKKHIRFVLAKNLESRFVPNISFEADLTGFYASKISGILNSDDVKKDL